MSMKSILIAIAFTFFVTGCHKMTFTQGGKTPSPEVIEQNHINLIYSLLEFSEPVNPSAKCQKQGWSSVTTQDTVITVILGSIDFIIGVDVVDFQSVEIRCADQK